MTTSTKSESHVHIGTSSFLATLHQHFSLLMQSILRSCLTEILHLCADFSRLWQSLNILTALAIYVSPSFSISLYIEVDVGHIWHRLRDKFVACRLTYIIPHYFCASCCPIVPLVINPINSKRTANLPVFVAQHSHTHVLAWIPVLSSRRIGSTPMHETGQGRGEAVSMGGSLPWSGLLLAALSGLVAAT